MNYVVSMVVDIEAESIDAAALVAHRVNRNAPVYRVLDMQTGVTYDVDVRETETKLMMSPSTHRRRKGLK